MNYQSTQWGPGAMEILQPTLTIPSSLANLAPADTGVVIFAPTNKPQGSCIEMTPIYQRLPGSSATSHSFGWYDWCQFPPQWTLIESMQDPFWLSDYTVTSYWPPEGQNVVELYWGIDQVGSDCWEGLLFNFTVGNYEQKAFTCGTPGDSRGWSMWESYYLSTYLTDPSQCPSLPHVDAYIPVAAGPIWLDQVPRSPIGPFGICWDSGVYWSDFYIDPNGGAHTWRAHTP